MPKVDVNTIIAITTLLCILLALVLVMLRRSYPPSIQGLGEWATAIGVSLLSTLLYLTRGHAPDLVSMPLAQCTVFVALYFYHRGCQRFFDQPVTVLGWSLWIGLTFCALTWPVVFRPDLQIYGFLSMSFMGLSLLALALQIWRYGPPLFSTRFTVLVLMAQVLNSAACAVADLFMAEGLVPLQLPGIRSAFVTGCSLAIMGASVGMILMATERLRTELEHLASRDSLTGALTRRVMADACAAELDRFKRLGRDIGLLMMDLDHFKSVNDTYGHFIGDRVLVDFVGRVRQELRHNDLLGRFGGEEFIVLLPETSLAGAQAVAERIRAAADSAVMPDLPHYSVSIGLTLSHAQDASIDVMLKRADAALYQAKAQGRNRVEVG